jgi:putative Mg2+ transporter-C (MgtC) family protein
VWIAVTVTITWYDIALRIGLTLIGSALIGINRGEHGQTAGLRTTMLVALAGALAMIEVNVLLGTVGKLRDSFVVLDLMRLPLGILTGMGFIGAGAILQRGNRVSGVTTAATLWLVTVIGLCFGGGQLALGSIAVVLAMFVLWTLKTVDRKWLQDNRATLTIRASRDTDVADVARDLAETGYTVSTDTLTLAATDGYVESQLDLRWRGAKVGQEPPPLLASLARRDGVLSVDWRR